MIENDKPLNVIQHLFDKDYENKTCVHCKSPMPTFASINNAIIICQQCAEKHKTLGYNISYVRELKDEWDPYLLSFFEMGGNSRFIRFSRKYELDDMPIEEKFHTKILEYYRLLLKSEILAEEPPLEIPFESAKEIDNNQKLNFPEFEKYEIYEGKTKIEKDPGKLVHAFRYVGKGLGNMKTFFEEYEIGSKLKTGGTATLNGISKAGNFLYGKTKEGIGYLYKKFSGENEKKNRRIIIEGVTDDGILYNEDDKEDNIINSNEKEKKDSSSNPINENNNEFKSSLSIMSNKSAAPIDMGTPIHGV